MRTCNNTQQQAERKKKRKHFQSHKKKRKDFEILRYHRAREVWKLEITPIPTPELERHFLEETSEIRNSKSKSTDKMDPKQTETQLKELTEICKQFQGSMQILEKNQRDLGEAIKTNRLKEEILEDSVSTAINETN